jgi:integrase
LKRPKHKHPGVHFYWKGARLYAIHRKTKTKIRHPPYSPAFAQEVERLNGLVAEGKTRFSDATLGWLIGEYRGSPEYERLGERTRKEYDDKFHWLRPLHGEPLSRFDGPEVIAIRNKAYKNHKRTFANYTVRVLSLLFNWGLLSGKAWMNPAARVPKIERPTTLPIQNRRWSDEECEVVMKEALAQYGVCGVTVILGLVVYHALREQDAVGFKRPGYNGRTLSWVTLKTGEVMDDIPVDPRLKEILDEYLVIERPFASTVLAVNQKGQPYTINGFLSLWQRLKGRLEKGGKIQPGLTIHGTRHTHGAKLGEMGFDPRAIANHLGDKSLAMGKLYSDQAAKSISRKQTSGAMRKNESAARNGLRVNERQTRVAKVAKKSGELGQ